MPWLALSITPAADERVNGTLGWLRPDAETIADIHDIPLPESLKTMDGQSSWASDGIGVYNCGGFIQNAIVTKNLQAWPLGMRAPGELPDVALSAGPGITANVICYIRGFDDLTGERTPLSGASGTLAAANQSITYSNLDDVILDPRWTHLEGWESRDGSLPRFVWRRQIGVITVTHALALGSLGEAETSEWEKPPRCRFNAMWHERLVMAGDDQNPTTIYFMAIGFPERWEGLSLNMKSRQRIVGLAEINGRLLVFASTVTEAVSGWTEDDLRIDIVQPHLGLVSHFSLVQTDSYLWIMTQEQPFLSDGSSWFPMGKDIKTKYAADFKANRRLFERMFVDHHPQEHIIRWYIETSTDYRPEDGFVWMVADYEPTLPLEGGGLEQPRWTYDLDNVASACAALAAVPAGRRQDPLQGQRGSGAIVRPLVDGEDGDGTVIVEILTGALQFGKLGGPTDHALHMQDISFILRSELDPWRLRIYSGDIECVSLPFLADFGAGIVDQGFTPAYDLVVDESAIAPVVDVSDPDQIVTTYTQSEWTHHFGGLTNVVGRAFKVRISAENPRDLHLAGLMILSKIGMSDRQPARVTVESVG